MSRHRNRSEGQRKLQTSKRDRLNTITYEPYSAHVGHLVHGCSSGQAGYTSLIAAEARAKVLSRETQTSRGVIPCGECDSYHVEGAWK